MAPSLLLTRSGPRRDTDPNPRYRGNGWWTSSSDTGFFFDGNEHCEHAVFIDDAMVMDAIETPGSEKIVAVPADGTFPVDKGNRDAAASAVSMRAVSALLKESPAVLKYHLSKIVFPEHLRFQKQKISASGSDLGGDLVFPKRIGFTGTPSDLLPQAMGACGFREGTEGEMVHTLTELRMMKPVVLRESLEKTGSLDWDSTMILTMIAQSHPAFEQPLVCPQSQASR